MSDVKSAKSPLDSKLKLNLEGEPLPNAGYYQRLVGVDISHYHKT